MTQLAPSDQITDEVVQAAADEVNGLVERLQGRKQLQGYATLEWQRKVDPSEALKVDEPDGRSVFPYTILATTDAETALDHMKCAYLVINRQKHHRVMFGVYDINSSRLILSDDTAEMLRWLSEDDGTIVQKVIVALRQLQQ